MIPFPNKKYNIILADPPWSYWAGGKKNASRHYKCQSIEWIWNLPVKNIADNNCALFLWSTFPVLPECIKTIEIWGFRFATNAFTWIKRNRKSSTWFWGCGNYTRANAEICLLGMEGTLKRKSKSVHQIIDNKIMEHSKKPSIIRQKIVELFGDIPRIELFARPSKDLLFEDDSYKGWDVWGDEV